MKSEALEDLSPHWARRFTPVAVYVITSYAPFTSAVVLGVEAVDTSPNVSSKAQIYSQAERQAIRKSIQFHRKIEAVESRRRTSSRGWDSHAFEPTTGHPNPGGVKRLSRSTRAPREMDDWMDD
ncbi:hypothetical protein B0H11DRAFT_2270690, partial [Mycena galericulata]